MDFLFSLQSSCSESESGIWTQKSKRSKISKKRDNYNDGSDEDNTESVGLNARGGKDDISSTQVFFFCEDHEIV